MNKIVFFISIFAISMFYSQIIVNSTAGTVLPTSYTTLKEAADAINAGIHQGDIKVFVNNDTTETSTVVFGAIATYNEITIKPAPGKQPKIFSTNLSGSANPLIRILGNNVNIDGSNAVGGSTRDLTFENSNSTSPAILYLGSSDTNNPIHNIAIKNTIFINGGGFSTAIMIGAGAGSAAGYFNDIVFQNNSIQKAYTAIFAYGVIAPLNGSGLNISDNDLSTPGSNAIISSGIVVQGVDGATIFNNTIGNFTDSNSGKSGINISTGTINTTVSKNRIFGFGYTGSGNVFASLFGIQVNGNVARSSNANITISENNIYNFSTKGLSTNAGIYIVSGSSTPLNNITIKKNRIYGIRNIYVPITPTATNSGGATGILLIGYSNSSININNNFISDLSNSRGASVGTSSEYNQNAYGIFIDNGSGYKIYNNSIDALSITDLANAASSSQPVKPVSSAIFISNRVTTAGAIDLRNNILSNNNPNNISLVGAAYAIYSKASPNVFNNIDYNNYYTSGSTLGFLNAGDLNSLSELTMSFGSNSHSVNVQPKFVAINDLHLTSDNIALFNAGTPLSDIIEDIDGDPRNMMNPEIGADESIQNLGISENTNNKTKIKIYPNPVVDILTISTDKDVNQIFIYNLSGQLLNEVKKSKTINLGKLMPGMYILKINLTGESHIFKVMKK